MNAQNAPKGPAPLVLVDEIECNAGAIVSKVLLDKPAGTITLFAFDAGQGLSEHTAPFDAVVQVLQGQADLTIAGESVTVGTGQMAVMPANAPHAVRAIEPFKMLLTMIRS